MKIIDCEQGSPEWLRERLWRPTSSHFDRILTPKTRKLSAQRYGYALELCAERILGEALDGGSSLWMERGTQLEANARDAYSFEVGHDVTVPGLCVTDDGEIGASTDGLVGDDGIIEIKCPKITTHLENLTTDDPYTIAPATQVQGGLWVTGRAWCDIVSYNDHERIPMRVMRVERDPEWMSAFDEAFPEFLAIRNETWARLQDQGCMPAPPRAPGNSKGPPFGGR